MQVSERQMQDRIGSVLFRLAELGQRADASDSPKTGARLLGEVRKLAADVEQMLTDMRAMLARYVELQEQAASACRRGDRIFAVSPVPCMLIEQASGTILDANPAAVRLLNVSHRHLVGRSFPLFLNGDRDGFVARVRRVGAEPEATDTVLRPRERSAVDVTLTAWRDTAETVFVMIVPQASLFAAMPLAAAPSPPVSFDADAPADAPR